MSGVRSAPRNPRLILSVYVAVPRRSIPEMNQQYSEIKLLEASNVESSH